MTWRARRRTLPCSSYSSMGAELGWRPCGQRHDTPCARQQLALACLCGTLRPHRSGLRTRSKMVLPACTISGDGAAGTRFRFPDVAMPACSSTRPLPSFLPRNVAIIGYARTQLTDQQLRDKLRPRLKGSHQDKESFLERCTYVAGGSWCCGVALLRLACITSGSWVGLPTEAGAEVVHQAAACTLWRHSTKSSRCAPRTALLLCGAGAYDGADGWKKLAAVLNEREVCCHLEAFCLHVSGGCLAPPLLTTALFAAALLHRLKRGCQ